MKTHSIILLLMALLPVMKANAVLRIYPAGQSVETLEDFTVEVRQGALPWTSVPVYPVKVDEVKETKHCVSVASLAYFDFDGEVDVRVVCRRQAADSVRLRPLSLQIRPRLERDTITFSLAAPANMSLEVNGDIFHNLHLFANPVDTHRPSDKELKKSLKKGFDSDLVYFGPGLHRLPGDTLRLRSGQTVYIDGGARVVGELIADGVRDVRVAGRGEVHPSGRGAGFSVRRSRNVTAEGIILTQLPVGGSDSVRVDNVKSISYYGWGDGMNVFASNNVRYNRVFCRNSDDCTTVYATRKGFKGGCRNILMENSTLWADVAHPIMIGLHGAAMEIGPDAPSDTIADVVYRNIDILDHKEKQIDYQGCMAINCGDNNVVMGITFDNIRVEDFREGQLFNIRIFFNKKYCAAPGACIRDVLFKDVAYRGANARTSIIAGYDETRQVTGIVFDNLRVNGTRISDDMPGKPKWYKTSDFADIFVGEHADGISFR